MKNESIEGRWNMVSWRQEYDDGRKVFRFGEQIEGFIEYGRGRMFCVLSKKPRTVFSTGGQWDAADSDKAAAYDEYLTYAGRYEFDGETVTHHIELCIFPNWQGSAQRRKVQRTAAGVAELRIGWIGLGAEGAGVRRHDRDCRPIG